MTGARVPNIWSVDVKQSGGGEETVKVECHWDPDYYNITEEVGIAAMNKIRQKAPRSERGSMSLMFANVRHTGGGRAPAKA